MDQWEALLIHTFALAANTCKACVVTSTGKGHKGHCGTHPSGGGGGLCHVQEHGPWFQGRSHGRAWLGLGPPINISRQAYMAAIFSKSFPHKKIRDTSIEP